VEKERIYVEEAEREIDTGDKICQDCKFVGTSNEFNRDIYDQELDDEIFDHPNLHIPKENLIKQTCKELNLTYKQLGEAIGYGEEAVSKAARTGNISATMNKALLLYLENLELKNKLKTLDTLSIIIKELSK
jgi:hypothetical protein cfetvA_04475